MQHLSASRIDRGLSVASIRSRPRSHECFSRFTANQTSFRETLVLRRWKGSFAETPLAFLCHEVWTHRQGQTQIFLEELLGWQLALMQAQTLAPTLLEKLALLDN
mmetsp:Transcript_923/g.2352  ORF Transcript_923/g.2352 Transcript_923/m.2352 type:complete len:105 (+) Transcript_923:88-402(+)